MRLSDLARLLPSADVRGDATADIRDATADSRAVAPETLFFCVPGHTVDGHDFAADAVSRGARAVVVERWLDLDAAQLRVASVRDAMGPLSAAVFGQPSSAMTVVGVTGTNGKTTSAFMLEKAFAAGGAATGLMGTVEVHIAGAVHPVVHTTPEAPDLQRLLARMRDAGVGAVAMEVSSHGLSLGRVAGTRFACGLFTNLTRDHLDFHRTMEDYESAKAMLFDGTLAARGAANVDDSAGRRLVERAAIPLVSFGLAGDAEVRAVDVESSREGSRFVCATDGDRVGVSVNIAGRYNVSNALGVMAVFRALGLPLEQAAEGIGALRGVPGRMEAIDAGQPFSVLVDYAHTPDSLVNVLRAAREVCEGSLIAVFGCGGDRDPGKRPVMGKIGTALADRAIITSDNPRSEDPSAIIAAIEAGAREASGIYEIEPDRRAAIARAVAVARAGDVVVIAGKGHETGQKFADRVVPFDDRTVAREELERLGAGR
jgi:UDP-N-acetylmuramoyl-L-alanyl-D-glutamate--2,6-diaminopimelate ligase